MSQEQEFIITSLLTKKELKVENNNVVLPLFPTDLYTFKVNVSKSNYTNKFRKAVRWDFGDGTIKEGSSAEHYYKIPGKYKITCTFYDIERKPYQSPYTVTVIVKEIIPISINFCNVDDENTFPKNGNKILTRSKLNKLLTIESTLNDNVKVLAPIIAKRIDNNQDKSYFDIKDESYYHTQRYFTFLSENKDASYKKNVTSKITLTPVQQYIPKYSPLYISYKEENQKIVPTLYAYTESDLEVEQLPTSYKIYNPNASVLINHYKGSDEYLFDCPINIVKFTKDIPDNSRFCGWLSRFNIWYKDDYIGDKELYFTYDTAALKFHDEKISPASLNIPPLGIKISVKDTDDFVYGLSGTGILSNKKIKKDELNVDDYLHRNLYIDYEVDAYLGKYVKNDTFNENEETWSILKSKNENVSFVTSGTTLSKVSDENEYLYHYKIKPTHINLKFTISDDKSKYFYTRDNCKSFHSVLVPYKKYKFINFEDVLNAYMPHEMYENTPVIKQFFNQLFETDSLFERINNKGFDFFDDIVNYKTCYIKNLQSILEMFDSSQLSYNLNSFDKVNELKELTRLLSMQYSELFGQFQLAQNDISINGDAKGDAVGDIIKPTDIIVCDIDYKITGIIRDKNFYLVPGNNSCIILHNNFNNETKLVSFYGLQPLSAMENLSEVKGLVGTYFFTFDDYHYSWGWNLQLPENFESSSNKAEIIDAYYSFYIYNNLVKEERKYNFIDDETIPYSSLPYTTHLTKEEWDDIFGYTYECIMKVLVRKLGLY